MRKGLLRLIVAGACFGATLTFGSTQANAETNFKRGIPAFLRHRTYYHYVDYGKGNGLYGRNREYLRDSFKFYHSTIVAQPAQGLNSESIDNYYHKEGPRTYIFWGNTHDSSRLAGSHYEQEYFYVKFSKNYRALKAKIGWTSNQDQYLPNHYSAIFSSKDIFYRN